MSPALPTAPFLLQELLTTNSKSPAFEDVLPGCQHDYYTVPERSVLPQLDERPGASTKWHAEAICRHCRCHLRIAIDFSQSSDPCPTQDYPLHHFRIEEEPGIYDRVQTVNFVCGGPQCKAHVTAEVRAPFLKNADVTSLTSIAALKERIAARARDGYGLEDPGPHTPAMALNTFQSYVRDSLKDNETKRIPTKNRKFMLALGDEASPLLLRLGFAFEPPAPDLNYGHWRLPKAASTSEGVLRLALSDVFDELGALLLQRPEAERVQTEVTIRQPPSSLKDLERTLGCLDCKRSISFASVHGRCTLRIMVPGMRWKPLSLQTSCRVCSQRHKGSRRLYDEDVANCLQSNDKLPDMLHHVVGNLQSANLALSICL